MKYDSEALDSIGVDETRDLPFEFGGRVQGLLNGPQDENDEYVTVSLSVSAEEASDRGIVFGDKSVEDVDWKERQASTAYLTDRLRRDLEGKLDPLLLNETYVDSGTADDEGFDVEIKVPRDYPQSLDTVFDEAIVKIGDRAGEYVDPENPVCREVWDGFDPDKAPTSPHKAMYDPVMQRAMDSVKDEVGPTGKVRVSRIFDQDNPFEPGVRSTFTDGSYTDFYPDPDNDDHYVSERFDPQGQGIASEDSQSLFLMGTDITSQASFADPGYVASTGDADQAEDGFYTANGTLYRVQTSGDTGRKFAQARRNDGKWMPAQIKDIAGGHRSHLDELEKAGKASGRCAICNRPLEGESAARGIGPKCAVGYSR